MVSDSLDRFVLHAEREEQLAEVGLDVDGLTRSALDLARAIGHPASIIDDAAFAG